MIALLGRVTVGFEYDASSEYGVDGIHSSEGHEPHPFYVCKDVRIQSCALTNFIFSLSYSSRSTQTHTV